MSRHARRRPLRTALLALLAVLALDAAAHYTLLLFLLLTAGAVLVWRRRRTARPVRGRPEPAEVTRMRAQLDQAGAELKDAHRQVARLEQELADAQEGMHRAWDQAAATPYTAAEQMFGRKTGRHSHPGIAGEFADGSCAHCRPSRDRLLDTPLSGVRPLFRGRP